MRFCKVVNLAFISRIVSYSSMLVSNFIIKFKKKLITAQILQKSYSKSLYRGAVSVGEKIPINIKAGGEDPVIKEDSEYPEWLHDVHKKLMPLSDLQKKWENDENSLNEEELMRLSRLITLKTIKTNNDRSN